MNAFSLNYSTFVSYFGAFHPNLFCFTPRKWIKDSYLSEYHHPNLFRFTTRKWIKDSYLSEYHNHMAVSILIIIAPIFHKYLKNVGCGWGEWPWVCDHLDVKEMSVSINTLEQI